MTTREICERLLKIHDILKDAQPPRADVLYEVDETIVDLAEMTTSEIFERMLRSHDLLKIAQPPRDDVLHEVDELLLNLVTPEKENEE